MALKQANRQSIVTILERTPEIPALAQWCIFLRNHDELTLEMVTEDERQYMWAEYAPDPRMRLNLGIRRRLAPLLDNDQRRIRLLSAMLFSLPGSPIIYYGDEIGMGDNIWLDDRDGVRTPMQWDASKNAGFSEADALYEPVIDSEDFSYRRVNVAQQQENPDSLWHFTRKILMLRKQYRAFGRSTFEFALPDNVGVLGYWRVYHNEETDTSERFLALFNLTPQPQHATLNLSEWVGIIPVDMLSGKSWPAIGNEAYSLELAPYAYHWLRLQR
jgi:maltose alpha-D-glucosyltransferase/alpha-amylase